MIEAGGLLPFTTIDCPGMLAAVVFCQGCPWRCRYCHNPHLIPATGDSPVPWPRIVALLERRRQLLDAVVFSGGEPTLQANLPAALRAVRGLGFKTGVHTAGPLPKRLEECLPLLDWVGMDLKAPFAEYQRITGVPGSGEAAERSARLLRDSGVAHQFRTTLDPFLRAEGRIEAMQRMVASWGEALVIQPLSGIGDPAERGEDSA